MATTAHDDHGDHGISHTASMKVLLATGSSLLFLTIVTVLATKVDFGANINFAIAMFIAVVNLIGIIPYTFTVTSHLIVTVCMALMVFATMTIYGFYKHGLKFFKLFVPHGIPIYILPLVVFIEVLSYFLKPVSHSVRLFANMLAGHIALKVFAGFVTMLGALGVVGWVGAVLPLALTVALTALELLVAFLQAYVFAILTCIYLNDAIHPGH